MPCMPRLLRATAWPADPGRADDAMVEDSSIGAWSLPAFAPRDLLQVGGGVAQAGSALVWIAPGASLGAAGFLPLPGGSRYLRIATRAGRAALEAAEPDELALLDLLRRGGRLDVDELLCDAGIVRLYRGVCRLRGIPAQRLRMEQVVGKALEARCPECARALTIFCALLGDFAARLALALDARGGVYLGGAAVAELADWFRRSPFRRRFDSQGRDRELLRAIPTFVVSRGVVPRMADPLRALSRMDASN